ncbi:MAG TPA: PAS domain-containing sensor histidine kinase [archaeon]|nr:PAS domain-containing sensor histidine kinase [archaeon]
MNSSEQNLNLSAEVFKDIFNLVPNPIYIWKKVGEDLILVDYNRAAENLSHFKIKDFLGVIAKEIYQNKPEIISDLYQCANSKLNFSKEINYTFFTNEEDKKLYVTYNYIPSDLILVLAEDITKQKKTEDYLKKSENEKTFILNGISELIVFQDTENNILWANKAAGDSVEIPQEELIGLKCYEVWHNREIPCEICPVNRAVKSGKPEIDDVISPDGKEWIIKGFPMLEENNTLIGITEVAQDISGQKKAERNLIESEKRYRLLFENMAAAFAYHKIIVDENNKPIDYQFLEVNPAFEEFTGLKISDIIGKKVTEVLPGIENDPADWIGKYGKVALTRTPITFENYAEPLDQWFSVAAYSPKENYFAVTFTNITERKKAELALRRSREDYRDAYNRINLYKDVFTHDINNILQNVLSSLELSKAFSYETTKIKEYEEVTKIIEKQISRGKKLVKNIQALSQIESYKEELSSIEVLNILEKAVEILKKSHLDKIINITITASQDEYHIRANKLLRRIFDNILDNAVYHNRNQLVEIVINVSRVSKNETDLIKIEIIDNGLGIPDPMKETIFLREIKVDDIPSGIGLGLLLVKRILESYNGEIRVEDRIIGDHSKGSKFIILIQEKPNNL